VSFLLSWYSYWGLPDTLRCGASLDTDRQIDSHPFSAPGLHDSAPGCTILCTCATSKLHPRAHTHGHLLTCAAWKGEAHTTTHTSLHVCANDQKPAHAPRAWASSRSQLTLTRNNYTHARQRHSPCTFLHNMSPVCWSVHVSTSPQVHLSPLIVAYRHLSSLDSEHT